MNVHWRKTQNFEFQKNEKTAIVIVTRNMKLQSCHGSSSNNNNEKPTNNNNGQICPISRLSLGQKKTLREEKKKKKKGTRMCEHKIGTKKQ